MGPQSSNSPRIHATDTDAAREGTGYTYLFKPFHLARMVGNESFTQIWRISWARIRRWLRCDPMRAHQFKVCARTVSFGLSFPSLREKRLNPYWVGPTDRDADALFTSSVSS
jgi:hypothetical protein